jgi:hypothetical protein
VALLVNNMSRYYLCSKCDNLAKEGDYCPICHPSIKPKSLNKNTGVVMAAPQPSLWDWAIDQDDTVVSVWDTEAPLKPDSNDGTGD